MRVAQKHPKKSLPLLGATRHTALAPSPNARYGLDQGKHTARNRELNSKQKAGNMGCLLVYCDAILRQGLSATIPALSCQHFLVQPHACHACILKLDSSLSTAQVAYPCRCESGLQ